MNAICPGPTLTDSTAPLLDLPDDQRSAMLSDLNPVGELVEADHIAQAVAYLCSAQARMINGQALALDGGQLAQL